MARDRYAPRIPVLVLLALLCAACGDKEGADLEVPPGGGEVVPQFWGGPMCPVFNPCCSYGQHRGPCPGDGGGGSGGSGGGSSGGSGGVGGVGGSGGSGSGGGPCAGAADGTPCDDGDACTQTDTCQGGVCTGSNPVTCTASDDCHAAGTCDPTTGACSNPSICPPAPPCFQAAACTGGTCEAPVPVRVDDENPCTADTCDPTSGVVAHTPLPDGTPCFDGTQTLTCVDGACSGAAPGGAPALYADPERQSPTRGDPGELLVLAGTGFDPTTVVVYQAVTSLPPPSPPPMPGSGDPSETATSGVIGTTDPNLWQSAYSVKVKLPSAMTQGQTYELWAANNVGGHWVYSNGVMINDARPMWVSPGPRILPPATSSPFVYTTAPRPGVGRTLKIVGRNLEPMPNMQTQVQFTACGVTSFTLFAANDGNPATQIERYAAVLTLPAIVPLTPAASITSGACPSTTTYTMTLSRDGGATWVPVPVPLVALPDPPAPPVFDASDYGDCEVSCDPCAGGDNTLCITRAVHAASEYLMPMTTACMVDGDCPSGEVCKPSSSAPSAPTYCGPVAATVHLGVGSCGNGVWHLRTNCNAVNGGGAPDAYFTPGYEADAGACAPPGPPLDTEPYVPCIAVSGITLPQGLSVVGDPCKTTIEADQGFDQPIFDFYDGNPPVYHEQYVFDLEGANVIQGLHFTDAWQKPASDAPGPGSSALMIDGDDITVTGNDFDGVYGALVPFATPTAADGLQANVDLIMTHNEVAAWQIGLSGGRFEDTVVSHNKFYPGGDPQPIAFAADGSLRLDVSDNKVDGSVTTYSAGLYGWRAGLFFASAHSNEDLLVAGNTIACTGTRPGNDGEAISVDSNGALPMFRWSKEIVSDACNCGSQPVACGSACATATTSTVTLAWPDGCTAPSVEWSTSPDTCQSPAAMVGSWMQVVHGPGLGQARKVTAVATDASTITLTVSPALDVLPIAGSRVIVVDQAWQAYFVDNTIDNTMTTCTWLGGPAGSTIEQAVHYASAGLLNFYGPTIDVSAESNTILDSAGIDLSATYYDQTYTDGGVTQATWQTPIFFVDVRANTLTGQFGGASNTANAYGSGITLLGESSVAVYLSDGQSYDPTTPGFGVTVAKNTMTDALLRYPTPNASPWPQDSGIFLTGIDAAGSPVPAYVDTVVFGNQVGLSAPMSGAVCTNGVQPMASDPYVLGTTYVSAIAVGNNLGSTDSSGDPIGSGNYPAGTVLCGNTPTNLACTYTDWPGQGETSSVSQCQ